MIFDKNQDEIIAGGFSIDGQYIVTASRDHSVKLWNINGAWVGELKENNTYAFHVEFSPDSRDILIASRDNTVKIWNLASRKVTTLVGHHAPLLSTKFSPDSTYVLTTARDKTQGCVIFR